MISAQASSYSLPILEAKREAILKAQEPKVVAVGSSHGDYSFDPVFFQDSYNLCSTSQDLYYSCLVLHWTLETLPTIETYIVFYSLFSYGFDLSMSNEKPRCADFRQAFDFNERRSTLKDQSKLNRSSYPFPEKLCLEHFERGFFRTNDRDFFSKDISSVERALGHLRYSDVRFTGRSLLPNLDKFIQAAQLQDKKVIVVVPPVRSDYRSVLPQSTELFPFIRRLCLMRQIGFLDLFAHEIFSDEDFGDTDHLLPAGNGPRKLAEVVKQVLIHPQQLNTLDLLSACKLELAEATARTEAVQIVLSAVVDSQMWRGLDRKKFRAIISEASRLVPNSGPRSVQHEVLLAEARKVLKEKN